MFKTGRLAAVAIAACAIGACTSAELEAISAGLSAGLADAAYDTGHAPYGSGYNSAARYGGWIGYNQCQNTGSHYLCDSNGDGYADMFGNTDDGSFSSSTLKVNGRGEAFTWGTDCACWQRNRAYDGPRQPDEIVIYDGD